METVTLQNVRGAGFWLSFIAAATIPVSVAASHTSLALAVVALAITRSFRVPPVGVPVLAFMAATLISLAASPDPAAGWPQIRKFYVWLMLLAVFSAIRTPRMAVRLFWAWILTGAVSAVWSFVEYCTKWSRARARGEDFYTAYVADRITGFMSHWMTFSGQMMMILLIAGAMLLWMRPRPRRIIAPAALVLLGLILAQTRGMWMAAFAGGAFLVAGWRPRLLALTPLLLIVALAVAPQEYRQRALSIVQPRGNLDSNQHRIVCWRTGWEMIRHNPLFGVGPERVKVEFDRYVPADISRPLPSGYYAHLHSIYVHYAAERGLPALLALLWLVGKMVYDFARALRCLGAEEFERRAILHGAIAVLIGVMVSGVTETNLGDSEVLAMFLATAACGYVAVKPEEVEKR